MRNHWILGFVMVLALTTGVVAEEAQLPHVPILGATLDKIDMLFKDNLGGSQAFGTPIAVGDLTLIPIVCKGLGFGMGTGFKSDEESGSRDRDSKEASRDRTGMGCGGGGFVKTVAILVVKKDGSIQLHRLQESGLAQLAKIFLPAIKQAISTRFQLRKMQMEQKPPAPPQPPK